MSAELTPKERKILAALIAHVYQADAARELGMSRHTLWKFLRDHPRVRAAWEEACFAAVEEANMTLASVAATAAGRIAEAVRTNAAPSINMLRTLELVLDRATAYMQERKLAEQIAALKRQLADRGIVPDGDSEAPQPGT